MGFFIRFAEVFVRCLCFHFSTYVVHVVSEDHFKLGTWAVTLQQRFNPLPIAAFREQQGGKGKRKLWGLRPQTPNQDVGWSQWARRRSLA